MAYIGTILKIIISIGAVCLGAFLGLKLEPGKEISDRLVLIVGVVVSTCSPIGLFLYVKYWELKPEFSSACGKQAIVGLIVFGCQALITHYFPPVFIPWKP